MTGDRRLRTFGPVSGTAERLLLQLVGLNMNPGLSITASIDRRSVGTPATYCGNGSVVTVSCEVSWSTSIFARTRCVGNVNGPTFNGTTIDRPYGAPS